MSNNFFPMASSRSGMGSPCGACKFLRRKCLPDCIFAPYFSSEESPARFAAIHKVFGASNVSKILLHVPVENRYQVAVTMAYEAEARLHDPVYGCVSHVFTLQQQVAFLKAQLMQLKENVTHQTMTTVAGDLRNTSDVTWQQTSGYTTSYKPYSHVNPDKPISPRSSTESLKHSNTTSKLTRFTTNVQEAQAGWSGFHHGANPNKKRTVSYCNSDLGDLQTLALRMMGNY